MKALAAWFTTTRRQAIQGFFGTLAVLGVTFGLATEDQTQQILIITTASLQFLASLLSLVNARWSDFWGIIRGAVYALVMVASPALVVLGVYDEATNTIVMVGVSLGLSSASSFIAIFTSGKQDAAAQVEALLVVDTLGEVSLHEDVIDDGVPHDANGDGTPDPLVGETRAEYIDRIG